MLRCTQVRGYPSSPFDPRPFVFKTPFKPLSVKKSLGQQCEVRARNSFAPYLSFRSRAAAIRSPCMCILRMQHAVL